MLNLIEIKIIRFLMRNGQIDKATRIFFKVIEDLHSETQQKTNIKKYKYPHLLTELGFNVPKSYTKFENYKKEKKAFDILKKAIQNVSPFVEVKKSRRLKKITYTPGIIQKKKQEAFAIRALLEAATIRTKTPNNFHKSLTLEILDAYAKQGFARQKRDEIHKIAYTNRANFRYRWW